MKHSRTQARVYIDQPQEREIRLRPFRYPDSRPGGLRQHFWFLELTGSAEICIGDDEDELEADLAAMRKLAAAAAEAAGLLEQLLAQRDGEAAGA